ncbi:hypothetical protein CBL_11073 [Carabus blaptoides fortunei]
MPLSVYFMEWKRYDTPVSVIVPVLPFQKQQSGSRDVLNILYQIHRQSPNAVPGVDPYIGQLPAHLKEKYRQELRHEHKILAYTEGYATAGTDRVYLPYKVIMIHARKP